LISSTSLQISDFSENIFLISLYEIVDGIEVSHFFFSLSEYLRNSNHWIEVVSGEDSLIVKYSLFNNSKGKSQETLEKQIKDFNYLEEKKEATVLRVPICYSEEFAYDLQDLKIQSSLSSQDIINLHSSLTYKVKMIGFTPGFAYLGDLPKELMIERLAKPRVNLVPGSVGIAGNRTGIYTLGGPGGWRIIGRTPLSLFNQKKKNPFIILPGMEVKFEPIDKDEFKNFKVNESYDY
tara:strand:- start:5896 stop:6603 length:708 start_codon:yes stop_codon:yes gene_type:complete